MNFIAYILLTKICKYVAVTTSIFSISKLTTVQSADSCCLIANFMFLVNLKLMYGYSSRMDLTVLLANVSIWKHTYCWFKVSWLASFIQRWLNNFCIDFFAIFSKRKNNVIAQGHLHKCKQLHIFHEQQQREKAHIIRVPREGIEELSETK